MSLEGGEVGVGRDISVWPGACTQTYCDEKPGIWGSSYSPPPSPRPQEKNIRRVEGKHTDGGLYIMYLNIYKL